MFSRQNFDNHLPSTAFFIFSCPTKQHSFCPIIPNATLISPDLPPIELSRTPIGKTIAQAYYKLAATIGHSVHTQCHTVGEPTYVHTYIQHYIHKHIDFIEAFCQSHTLVSNFKVYHDSTDILWGQGKRTCGFHHHNPPLLQKRKTRKMTPAMIRRMPIPTRIAPMTISATA